MEVRRVADSSPHPFCIYDGPVKMIRFGWSDAVAEYVLADGRRLSKNFDDACDKAKSIAEQQLKKKARR